MFNYASYFPGSFRVNRVLGGTSLTERDSFTTLSCGKLAPWCANKIKAPTPLTLPAC